MRPEAREWLLLVGKTVLVIIGGILTIAALVELSVGGPWFTRGDNLESTLKGSAGLVLLLGLGLAVPPIALAFRDAVRAAHRGER